MNSEIEANRAIALYHLRVNPNNRTQIKGYFTDGCNGRCAVGLLCEAFNIPIASTKDESGNSEAYKICSAAYAALAKKLGLQDGPFNRVWVWNDSPGDFTYAKIADLTEEKLFSDPLSQIR